MSDLNTVEFSGGSATPQPARRGGGDANPSDFAGIIFNIERRNARSNFK